MIDLHTHLLPGLDDGPETVEESLWLAAAMVADGVTIAACTPHVRDDYETTPEKMETALAVLQSELAAAQIPLEVRGGGEIALDELGALDADSRCRFGLGGNPQLLLLEFPYLGWPLALPSVLSDLGRSGIVPVLGHPERNSDVQEQPQLLRPLVEAGAYVQLTAGSIDGSAGADAARCARALLDHGLAHLLASDSHGPKFPRASLGSGRIAIGSEALATWLTETVPGALLAGAVPAPKPVRAQGRRRRR
jgi:protein-tyrosine phosphatase